jgi:hypothetical protein
VIPHDVENALFAGIFMPWIPQYGGSIPRENSARSRQSRLCAVRYVLGAQRWPSANPLHQAILEGLAERFLKERRVCGEAAGRKVAANSGLCWLVRQRDRHMETVADLDNTDRREFRLNHAFPRFRRWNGDGNASLPFRPVLRGLILTGGAPLFARAELGRPGDHSLAVTDALWWPAGKIVGRYLAPFLAERSGTILDPPAAFEGLSVEADLSSLTTPK